MPSRGRPRKTRPLSGAERARRYRARQARKDRLLLAEILKTVTKKDSNDHT